MASDTKDETGENVTYLPLRRTDPSEETRRRAIERYERSIQRVRETREEWLQSLRDAGENVLEFPVKMGNARATLPLRADPAESRPKAGGKVIGLRGPHPDARSTDAEDSAEGS